MAHASTFHTASRYETLRSALSDALTGPIRFDPLGLVSGFKAYRIYTQLAAKSDLELSRLGLTRQDVPHAAIAAVSHR